MGCKNNQYENYEASPDFNPNEKEAKMFGAVKRFGVMQKLPYPEKDIEQIADYIFDNQIDEPKWFQAHFNQDRSKDLI